MESRIEVNIMGSPSVLKDGEKVVFPYRKAEGLFYYLCVNNRISRNEAISILWAENNEVAARKNLRDAIYHIKKLFGNEILTLEGNTFIELNRSQDIHIDLEEVTEENIVTQYKGEFLQYFYVRNCYEFENWLDEERERYARLYMKGLKEQIELCSVRDKEFLEESGRILLQNQVWDEEIHREVMRKLAEAGQYQQAVKQYQSLSEMLEESLETEPEDETTKLYHYILKLKDKTSKTEEQGEYFFGRSDILYRIFSSIKNVPRNTLLKAPRSYLLLGEAGVGKTTLMNHLREMVKDLDVLSFSWRCCQTEKDLYLKPWHGILGEIEEYCRDNGVEVESGMDMLFRQETSDIQFFMTRFEILTESMFRYLVQNFEGKQILLFVDDLQWMDKMSLRLLSNLMFRMGNKQLILIATCRDDLTNDLESFQIPLVSNGILEEVSVLPFTWEETCQILADLAGPMGENQELIEKIYGETKGNPLFLMELIQVLQRDQNVDMLTPKLSNIIKSRFLALSQEEIALLNCLSVFPLWATVEELQQIFPGERDEIEELTERLLNRHLLNEKIHKFKSYVQFRHQIIQEYVYSSLASRKRASYHRQLIGYYESRYKKTRKLDLCSMLIYHCQEAGDVFKMYSYKLEYLNAFYTVQHEMYPETITNTESGMVMEGILTGEDELMELAEEIRSLEVQDVDMSPVLMRSEYILGRYQIYSGDYGAGRQSIEHSILLAHQLEDWDALYDNYLQMVFLADMERNLEEMGQYIDKTMDLLSKEPYNLKKYAPVLRQKCLYFMKQGDSASALRILTPMVEQLEEASRTDPSYQVSLSASYNYVGECMLMRREWEKALEGIQKAIHLREDGPKIGGRGIFYLNGCIAMHFLGRDEEAKEYLKEAIACGKKAFYVAKQIEDEEFLTAIQKVEDSLD